MRVRLCVEGYWWPWWETFHLDRHQVVSVPLSAPSPQRTCLTRNIFYHALLRLYLPVGCTQGYFELNCYKLPEYAGIMNNASFLSMLMLLLLLHHNVIFIPSSSFSQLHISPATAPPPPQWITFEICMDGSCFMILHQFYKQCVSFSGICTEADLSWQNCRKRHLHTTMKTYKTTFISFQSKPVRNHWKSYSYQVFWN